MRSVVLLPFEDLRGAEGEPIAEALRIALAQSLEAQIAVLPVTPSHLRDVAGIPVTFRVDGYVGPDGFHLSMNGEPVVCKGQFADCLGPLVSQVASRTGAAAPAVPPARAVLALENARKLASEQGWREAAEAHKNYGPVWLGRIEHAAAGGAEAALAIAAKAETKDWRPIDTARLEVLRAVLVRDKSKTAETLERLASLVPADFQIQQRAAAALLEARRFTGAVARYEHILSSGPNPAVANEAAYAALFAGDRAKAENFVARARQGAPADTRFIDTAGDVAYYFGDYAAAARHFASANAHLKAAEAFAIAGDQKNAEAMLSKQPDDGLNKALLLWRIKRDASALEKSANPRAPFFLALAKLAAKDFAGAKALQQRVKQPSVEFVILSALIDAPPQNAPEGLHAIHACLRGDKARCLAQITAAKTKLHPFADSSLRRIEASVNGEKSTGYLPAALDDWLAFLAR